MARFQYAKDLTAALKAAVSSRPRAGTGATGPKSKKKGRNPVNLSPRQAKELMQQQVVIHQRQKIGGYWNLYMCFRPDN